MKNLIVTEDGFVWKVLTKKEAIRMYKYVDIEIYEVFETSDGWAEGLIDDLEEIKTSFKSNKSYVCIEVGFVEVEIINQIQISERHD